MAKNNSTAAYKKDKSLDKGTIFLFMVGGVTLWASLVLMYYLFKQYSIENPDFALFGLSAKQKCDADWTKKWENDECKDMKCPEGWTESGSDCTKGSSKFPQLASYKATCKKEFKRPDKDKYVATGECGDCIDKYVLEGNDCVLAPKGTKPSFFSRIASKGPQSAKPQSATPQPASSKSSILSSLKNRVSAWRGSAPYTQMSKNQPEQSTLQTCEQWIREQDTPLFLYYGGVNWDQECGKLQPNGYRNPMMERMSGYINCSNFMQKHGVTGDTSYKWCNTIPLDELNDPKKWEEAYNAHTRPQPQKTSSKEPFSVMEDISFSPQSSGGSLPTSSADIAISTGEGEGPSEPLI